MVDNMVGNIAQKLTKQGEKSAPVKSLKIKVKFQKTKSIEKAKKK